MSWILILSGDVSQCPGSSRSLVACASGPNATDKLGLSFVGRYIGCGKYLKIILVSILMPLYFLLVSNELALIKRFTENCEFKNYIIETTVYWVTIKNKILTNSENIGSIHIARMKINLLRKQSNTVI